MRLIFSSLIMVAALAGYCQDQLHALIVANSNYGAPWTSLHSKPDAALIQDALIKKGFKKENIMVIYDADRQTMMWAFHKYLIEKADTGGVAFFHYSGHGQQITDDNGDEVDGYDEALVGIDAPPSADFSPGYLGQKHVRDDEIGDSLDVLRKRLGANGSVLVTIDACMSGTATRGFEKVQFYPHTRGTTLKCELPAFDIKNVKPTEDKVGLGLVKPNVKYADLAVITAASKYQLDQENASKNCGSLSYAFNIAFKRATPESTYKSLMEDITNIMSEIQVTNKPEFEGNLHKQILGNKITDQSKYFTASEIDPKLKQVIINGGELDGIIAGAELTFYDKKVGNVSDTANAKPIAVGKVLSSNISGALVQIEHESGDVNMLRTAHIFIRKMSFAGLVTRIKVDPVLRREFDTMMAYARSKSIILDDSDYSLSVKPHAIPAQSLTASYDLYDRFKKIGDSLDDKTLFYRIIEYGRVNLLLSLHKGYTKGVEFNLLKATNCKPNTSNDGKLYCEYQSLPKKSGSVDEYPVKDSDSVAFQIINAIPEKNGDQVNKNDLYFLLFEISPLHTIETVFPMQNQDGSYAFNDCNLKASDTLMPYATTWCITPPDGRYQFKLLVSQEKFDQDAIRNLYLPEGITEEANKFISYRGSPLIRKGAQKDNQESNLRLKEISGAIDLYYDNSQLSMP